MYNKRQISTTKSITLGKRQALFIEEASFWINRQESYDVDFSIYAQLLSLPAYCTIEIIDKIDFSILYGSPIFGFHGELLCELLIPALSHKEIQQTKTIEGFQKIIQQLISSEIHATSCFGFLIDNHIDVEYIQEVKTKINHLLQTKGLHVHKHLIHMNLNTQSKDKKASYSGRNYLEEIGMEDENV